MVWKILVAALLLLPAAAYVAGDLTSHDDPRSPRPAVVLPADPPATDGPDRPGKPDGEKKKKDPPPKGTSGPAAHDDDCDDDNDDGVVRPCPDDVDDDEAGDDPASDRADDRDDRADDRGDD